MELYVKMAIDLNVETICFTDHVDFNKNDYGYDYYNSENFFEKYNKINAEYGNNIDLYAGIEFGEPHLYAKELAELSKKPYDFIIGSIHWIGNMFPCQKVREQYTAKEFYNLYWEEVLKTVKQGGFNSLGHIDLKDAEWQDKMVEMEMRVSDMKGYKDVAFFHHLTIEKR